MSYSKVEGVIQRAIEELVALGASREVIEHHAQTMELAAIQSIADNAKSQLLLDFTYSSAALAERYNVSERTIRNWRKAAINRKSPSAPLAA